jgi:integrase
MGKDPKMALTQKAIAQLKEPGRYGDGNRSGLYVQVQSPTNRSWIMRYERDGREHWLGLGSLHVFNLAEARDRARKARQLIADGIDPLEQKKADKAARTLAEARNITFEKAAKAYFDQHEKKWRNPKARAQFLGTLSQFVFPKIGRMSVADIDVDAVLRVLEQKHPDHPTQTIWQAVPTTANRVRGRIENVLDWAKVRKYRDGDNPATWRGTLENALPARGSIQKVVHHSALPFAELPAFMAALKEREGVAARALTFTVLTAARSGEVRGATWAEINLKDAVWTIPAERMKAKKEHRVPLSGPVIEILSELPREKDNAHVFIGTRRHGLSEAAMAAVLNRMDRLDITVHGFRSAFRDWISERTSYPNHVAEMALAHAIGSAVEKAYRRGDLFDKRVRLMAEWAKFATTEPAEITGKLIALNRNR